MSSLLDIMERRYRQRKGEDIEGEHSPLEAKDIPLKAKSSSSLRQPTVTYSNGVEIIHDQRAYDEYIRRRSR